MPRRSSATDACRMSNHRANTLSRRAAPSSPSFAFALKRWMGLSSGLGLLIFVYPDELPASRGKFLEERPSKPLEADEPVVEPDGEPLGFLLVSRPASIASQEFH